ncbi:MAG TPA: pyridoxal phosphate-dependent aminotransferase [Candidatus Sumerlaeota bacterium]|nr:MAG: Aspartate aminotransferase [candidate division BRC1 bacterium ADurb.BinA292]HOE95938.1 pyridoxal phosphate-dependent aminotransferase [Candidatus Sumerlaeota bacterium]HPK01920.1 pyridoxal phosphate-dependent aminotransferase [Candidatus Sumerlaeota bacterium]
MTSPRQETLDRPAPALPSRIAALPRVGSRVTDQRIAQLKAQGREILPLTAYPHRELPESALAAGRAALDRLDHPPARGLRGLRAALADYWGRLTAHAYDPDREVLITAGTMHALMTCFMAILDPGDEVLLPTPAYFFDGSVVLAGGVLRFVPFDEADDFRWRPERLEAAVGPRTRAILLNTPTNPTGAVASRDDLEQIAAIAEKHDLYVICDESYDRLVYDGGRHVSLLECETARDRLILAASFTKSFAMANWRVGYLIGPPPVMDAALKALEWSFLYGPLVNQCVAEAVLRHDLSWLDGVGAEFQANRDRLCAALAADPRLSFVRPRGNPFIFLNVSRLGDDARVASHLLEHHGLPCTAGHLHGAPGYLRVAFGGPPAAVDEAARRILRAADELAGDNS